MVPKNPILPESSAKSFVQRQVQLTVEGELLELERAKGVGHVMGCGLGKVYK